MGSNLKSPVILNTVVERFAQKKKKRSTLVTPDSCIALIKSTVSKLPIYYVFLWKMLATTMRKSKKKSKATCSQRQKGTEESSMSSIRMGYWDRKQGLAFRRRFVDKDAAVGKNANKVKQKWKMRTKIQTRGSTGIGS